MFPVKLRSPVVALAFGLMPFAAFAYTSTGNFPGTQDGPSLASDHSGSLQFGFNPSSDLTPVTGQGAYLNATGSSAAPAAPPQDLRDETPGGLPSQFEDDFYGYR